MAHSWVAHGRPWATAESLRDCSRETAQPLSSIITGFLARGEERDALHFWLLSLLDAPFWALFRAMGAPVLYSFALLHLALFLLAAHRLYVHLGPAGALACSLALVSSPLIFFIDKAHAEFFVCWGILLALVELHRGALLPAAFWFAVASNQQTALVPFAIALTGAWFLFSRRRRDGGWFLGVIVAGLLAPLYYLTRYGKPSLLAGMAVDWKLMGAHRAFSLYLDPDIGLFANWPAGLLLILVQAGLGFAFRKHLRDLLPLAATAAAFVFALPFFVSGQVNWNSGGTVHISRYAVLLIPVVSLGFAAMVGRVWRMISPYRWAQVGAICLALFSFRYTYQWNFPRFTPRQNERYLEHTQLAAWLYKNRPDLYDPVPEVFLERTIGSEMYSQYLSPDTWSVSDTSCNKLLLVRSLQELPAIPRPAVPLGCYSAFDTKDVVARLVQGNLKPSRAGFLSFRD